MSDAVSIHADRPVEPRVWRGRPAVAKTYNRGGAEDAAHAMRELWSSPFGRSRLPPGLPEPLALVGRSVIMERLEGTAVGRRGALGATEALKVESARLLGDLHGCRVRIPRSRPGARVARSLERKRDSLSDQRIRQAFDSTLALLDTEALSGELVVTHGDFSPRNVIATGGGLRLIDFDRLQMAPRARDVTYWGAWAWATMLLAGDAPSWRLGAAFELAYAAHTGVPTFAAAHRAAHRAAALLRITHGWTALRDRPDVAAIVVEEAGRQAAGSVPGRGTTTNGHLRDVAASVHDSR